MHRIRGSAKDYTWGSTDAIPELLGQPATDAPLAELWFGAHPAGAATLVDAPDSSLVDLLDDDPLGTLGADVLERFGPHLPYLLKLIAPARPLSLQVHPSLERAQRRHAEEVAAGIPADRRNYADANHKPELVYALTTFRAMSGFRAPRRAAELVAGLDVPLARRLQDELRADRSGRGMRAAFTRLLDEASRPTPAEVAELAEACAARLTAGSPSPRADDNVVTLHAAYPGDPGVVASLLLNPVTLRPGEAMFVPAGSVHAYLSGLAVEIMASSDNVLRAGLTAKRIDVGEMLQCVDYVAAPPIRIAPERFLESTRVFYAPVDDFELSVTELPGDRAPCPLPGRGPRVILALGGPVSVRSASGAEVSLRDGESVFVRADDGEVTVAPAGPPTREPGARDGTAPGVTVIQADVP